MTLGFEEFVGARSPALLRLAFLLCGDSHQAEDLVQSALTKAYRHWERVEVADHPEAYVRQIIVREHSSWWRRASSKEVITESPAPRLRPHELIDDHAIGVAETDAAWKLLAVLPRKQRVVLVLRFYLDLSDDQIAALLGCAPGTVRSNASRALGALREAVSVPERETLP